MSREEIRPIDVSTLDRRRDDVIFEFAGYTAHHWTPRDRQGVADIVRVCLEPYGLEFEGEGADKDAVEVEEFYQQEERGGEFWVLRKASSGKLVGSGGFYQVEVDGEGRRAAEIRKMYLLPEARGKKLGRFLLEVGSLTGRQKERVDIPVRDQAAPSEGRRG